MSFTEVGKSRRLRGAVLKLLRTNHDSQKGRMDGIALWSALVRGLGFDAGQNEVVTCLQDMQGRGYLTFQQSKDKRTNHLYISMIELCPKGRDLLEETIVDPAVEL
jgi:hypothetical protein